MVGTLIATFFAIGGGNVMAQGPLDPDSPARPGLRHNGFD